MSTARIFFVLEAAYSAVQDCVGPTYKKDRSATI